VAVKVDRPGDSRFRLVPDPTRRSPGRGAHLHPDPACLALAQRRHAFGRALRLSGVMDAGALVEIIGPGHTRQDDQHERTMKSLT
jgi:uncharacterized protein